MALLTTIATILNYIKLYQSNGTQLYPKLFRTKAYSVEMFKYIQCENV